MFHLKFTENLIHVSTDNEEVFENVARSHMYFSVALRLFYKEFYYFSYWAFVCVSCHVTIFIKSLLELRPIGKQAAKSAKLMHSRDLQL